MVILYYCLIGKQGWSLFLIANQQFTLMPSSNNVFQ